MKKTLTITKTELEKQISPIVTEAQSLSIITQEDMQNATPLLSNLNKHLDLITKEKERVTKPLNEALKAERSRWKPLESSLEEAITLIRNKMSSFQTEALKAQKQAEDKIATRVEKGTLKIETAMDKLANLSLNTPSKKIETNEGSIRFRTDRILKITHPDKIPRKFLIPDEKAILTALKANLPVEGCTLEEVQTVINSR